MSSHPAMPSVPSMPSIGALILRFFRGLAGPSEFSLALKDYLTTRGGSTGTSSSSSARLVPAVA